MRNSSLSILVLAGAALFFSACGARHAKVKTPRGPYLSTGERFVGETSWYGRRFHGRKTANGERFNMYQDTAAHRSLPFGTLLKVTNLDNKKSLVVRVNDRGPYHGKRVLDVSYGVAQKLGFAGEGTAEVRAEIVRPNPRYLPPRKDPLTDAKILAIAEKSMAVKMPFPPRDAVAMKE